MSLARATRSMIEAKEQVLAVHSLPAAGSVVLSYAHADRGFVEQLADDLSSQGIAVWWDDRIGAGEHIDETIVAALDAARTVVVLWSDASVKSEWVRWEANQALKSGKLVPVALPGLDLRDIRPPFSSLNTLAYEDRARLIAEVKRHTERGRAQ